MGALFFISLGDFKRSNTTEFVTPPYRINSTTMKTRRIPLLLATIGIAGYLVLRHAFEITGALTSFFLGLGVIGFVFTIICISRDLTKKD